MMTNPTGYSLSPLYSETRAIFSFTFRAWHFQMHLSNFFLLYMTVLVLKTNANTTSRFTPSNSVETCTTSSVGSATANNNMILACCQSIILGVAGLQTATGVDCKLFHHLLLQVIRQALYILTHINELCAGTPATYRTPKSQLSTCGFRTPRRSITVCCLLLMSMGLSIEKQPM